MSILAAMAQRRRKNDRPDPRQGLLPMPGILKVEDESKVHFREPVKVEPTADDPRTMSPYVKRALEADIPVYCGKIRPNESTRRCGAEWGLDFDGDLPLGRAYEIVFDPCPEHLTRLFQKGVMHDRASAEKEAERLRSLIRLPLKQFLLEDGEWVTVHEFNVQTLRWVLRWRQGPDGTVEDLGEALHDAVENAAAFKRVP